MPQEDFGSVNCHAWSGEHLSFHESLTAGAGTRCMSLLNVISKSIIRALAIELTFQQAFIHGHFGIQILRHRRPVCFSLLSRHGGAIRILSTMCHFRPISSMCSQGKTVRKGTWIPILAHIRLHLRAHAITTVVKVTARQDLITMV